MNKNNRICLNSKCAKKGSCALYAAILNAKKSGENTYVNYPSINEGACGATRKSN